jgi:hypothetical protein
MKKGARGKQNNVNNLVVISDTHCGCRLGLCPDSGIQLDDGGTYQPSRLQKVLWSYWQEFWQEHVPSVTRGEPFAVCHCGDATNGSPHQSKTNISDNWADQDNIASLVLGPVVELCGGLYFHLRGTEAHVGKSAEREEMLARSLGAKPNEHGQYARYELWKRVGPKLVHCLHHIGTTGSQAYEATAVHKELTESFVEAARWEEEPPDMIVRGHRHRYLLTEIATSRGATTASANAIVLPAWQGKTAYVWRIAGGRLAPPQFGGAVIRYSDESGELYVRPKVWTVARSKAE